MRKITSNTVVFGTDPELFLSKNGKIIGSEKVIPDNGIPVNGENGTRFGACNTKIVLDGVQIEFNPTPNTCRANLGNELAFCFRKLKDSLGDNNVDFSGVVKIEQEELDSLSEKSKVFGCMPSGNIYTHKESIIKVDPKKYLFRSAGGHIHLGYADYDQIVKDALSNTDVMVPMLDIIVGNTCVLLDRNPMNKERRKVYGRAGEFRQPKHGLEYRTLSNFWLQSYQLFSMVTGLARQAVDIVASSENNDLVKKIMSKVKQKDITKAINTNSFVLAMKNFDKIKKPLLEMMNEYEYEHYPLHYKTIEYFEHFVKKGVNYWFKENPLEHWVNLPEGHDIGFESYLQNQVREDMGL